MISFLVENPFIHFFPLWFSIKLKHIPLLSQVSSPISPLSLFPWDKGTSRGYSRNKTWYLVYLCLQKKTIVVNNERFSLFSSNLSFHAKFCRSRKGKGCSTITSENICQCLFSEQLLQKRTCGALYCFAGCSKTLSNATWPIGKFNPFSQIVKDILPMIWFWYSLR